MSEGCLIVHLPAKTLIRGHTGYIRKIFILHSAIWGRIHMDFFVRSQVARFREFFEANIAFKWLLTSVSTHVDLQSARSHEALATLVALERSLARVPPEVVAQVSVGCEGPIAALEGALERPLAIMYPLVGLQIAFLCESLCTAWEIADKGFLAGMCSLVNLQTASS